MDSPIDIASREVLVDGRASGALQDARGALEDSPLRADSTERPAALNLDTVDDRGRRIELDNLSSPERRASGGGEAFRPKRV